MSSPNDSANAGEKLLAVSGNGGAVTYKPYNEELEMPPTNPAFRSGGPSNGGPGGRASSSSARASRCVCCKVCGVVMLALLSVAVLVLAVAVAWHQWEIRGLKTGLNQTAESGNYYGGEIEKLRDELITLRFEAKRLHAALAAMANSSGGGKFDLLTSNKLDYAKLDALNDENRDEARQEAFEMITPFKSDPQYNSDPEFLRRLATVQYFDAMKVLEQNPNAKNAALQSLVSANVSIYKAYGLATNKTALLYKW